MADALCGPSNAIQNFQKHSNVDRTLQQDRLVNRRAQAENFRSEQARNAGILDPEFEAFQAGHAPMLEHNPIHHDFNLGGPPPPPVQFAPQPAVSGWAADFQKLHISQPPMQHAPQVHNSASASWHQEFQRQRGQAPVMPQSQHMGAPFSSMGFQRPMGYMPSSSQQQPIDDTQWKGKQKWPVESEIDQAAFDREFEMFASETLQRDATEAEVRSAEMGQDIQLERQKAGTKHVEISDPADELLQEEPQLKPPTPIQDEIQPLHPEEIVDQPTEQIVDGPIEDDGLAEPAGRLLEHVADNTTEKFQNSQFLDLMRRLRDRETVLKGEEFVTSHKATHAEQQPSAQQPSHRPYVRIPPEEQDTDLGRDGKMSGALPPMDEIGWSEKDRPLPLDPSFRHRHLVDDF